MRVLFVDDEPRILDGLRRMLWQHRNTWSLHFAEGPGQALALLREAAFDVVVSDMRMPGTDGAALLAIVMREAPGSARIVLSGQADASAAERVAGVAHQYVSKPCSPEELIGAIDRAAQSHALVPNADIRGILGRVMTLPSPERAYADLLTALAGPAPISRLSSHVERDPGITALVLHLVNSTFFARARTGNEMEAALGTVGFGRLRNVLLARQDENRAALSRIGSALSIEAEARLAWLTSRIAREAAQPGMNSATLCIAGVLHDVGKAVMAGWLPECWQSVLARAHRSRIPVWMAERAAGGPTHTAVGGYLLNLWGMCPEVVATAVHHHDLAGAPAAYRDIVAVVHVADVLAQDALGVGSGDAAFCEPDAAAVERIGGSAALARLRDAAHDLASA